MTAPAPPQQTPPPQTPPTAAEAAAAQAEAAALAEDTSSLLPSLTAILAAYLAYRASKGFVKGRWESIARVLRLESMAGAALGNVALRALTRQRRRLSRDATIARGDLQNLAVTEPKAVAAATRSAERIIAETVRDWSRRYRPDGTDSEVFTADRPDREIIGQLAEHVAHATANAAVAAAADLTPGWRKAWHSRNDTQVRMSHAFLGAKGYPTHIVSAGEPFVSPTGARLMYPGDPRAPLDEVINCRCWMSLYPAVNAAGKAGTTRLYAPGAEQSYASWQQANRQYRRNLADYRRAIAQWESNPPVLSTNKPKGPPQQPKPFAHAPVALTVP